MAVDTTISFRAVIAESGSGGLGTGVNTIVLDFPGTLGSGNYTTGTTSNKFDRVWSGKDRTLTATSESLDLAGSGLTAVIGGATITYVEVCGVWIRNQSLTDELIIGNGTAGAFTGMFGALAHTITVPASGMFFWFAPIDGNGLIPTATTADILKVDAGAATITYDICILGRSA